MGEVHDTVRAAQGLLSALGVFLCKLVLYGVFVWARRALNSQKRWFPARAVPGPERKQLLGLRLYPQIERDQPELAGKLTGMLLELDDSEVRKISSWPRGWANFSLF